jgi:hypothetical protein
MTCRAVVPDLLESGAGFQVDLLLLRDSRGRGRQYEQGPGNDECTDGPLLRSRST